MLDNRRENIRDTEGCSSPKAPAFFSDVGTLCKQSFPPWTKLGGGLVCPGLRLQELLGPGRSCLSEELPNQQQSQHLLARSGVPSLSLWTFRELFPLTLALSGTFPKQPETRIEGVPG